MQGRLLLTVRSPSLQSGILTSRELSSSPPTSGGGIGADGDGGSGVAVKQVTRGNLAESLEELRVRVREATFVGIDLETSGVTSAPWRDTFELDRSDVRYLKLRAAVRRPATRRLPLPMGPRQVRIRRPPVRCASFSLSLSLSSHFYSSNPPVAEDL
jgi:poly(A)-specific ribonuclease